MISTEVRSVLAAVAVVLAAAGCDASRPTGVASSASACTDLGGTLGSDDICDVHDGATNYSLTFRFPIGYADQQAVTDELKRRRTDFIEWVRGNSAPPPTHPYELHVTGEAYHSGTREHGTQSLVLTFGNDTGVHPVRTYKAFNFSMTNHSPFTFEALFRPGADPVPIVNPIVRQEILKRDPTAFAAVNGLTTSSYQQFAVTDDAVIFFFNQDGVMPHHDGPLEVTVPRSALASILA